MSIQLEPFLVSLFTTVILYALAMLFAMSHVSALAKCKNSPPVSYMQFIFWPFQLHKIPFVHNHVFLTCMYLAFVGLLLTFCSFFTPDLVGVLNVKA